MNQQILNELLSIFDITAQLDVLYKHSFGDILLDYTYAEMHCIDCIGKIENPNVTKIALTMKLSKAAISKNIKKLLARNSIETYKNPDNKKEIYYKLTPIGLDVFDKHLKMHETWYNKDNEFFKQFNKKDLEIIFNILSKYNKTLQGRLDNIKDCMKKG
ncbi:MAG: MarR family transcriptional regulator [Fusobacterium sp.]|nr:MarR family transcriptional regulator [Fusobacterium sp.]